MQSHSLWNGWKINKSAPLKAFLHDDLTHLRYKSAPLKAFLHDCSKYLKHMESLRRALKLPTTNYHYELGKKER